MGFAAQCEWIVSDEDLVNATAGLAIYVAREQHMLICSKFKRSDLCHRMCATMQRCLSFKTEFWD